MCPVCCQLPFMNILFSFFFIWEKRILTNSITTTSSLFLSPWPTSVFVKDDPDLSWRLFFQNDAFNVLICPHPSNYDGDQWFPSIRVWSTKKTENTRFQCHHLICRNGFTEYFVHWHRSTRSIRAHQIHVFRINFILPPNLIGHSIFAPKSRLRI